MTSLLKGRKTQTNKYIYGAIYNSQCAESLKINIDLFIEKFAASAEITIL